MWWITFSALCNWNTQLYKKKSQNLTGMLCSEMGKRGHYRKELPDSRSNLNTKWNIIHFVFHMPAFTECCNCKRAKTKGERVFFPHFKGASCNLFSIKLLINTRVVLGSLSTLPHLQKIKDARFPCHCLCIECEPFPEWGDLGPLWLTWGHSINTQLKHSAARACRRRYR